MTKLKQRRKGTQKDFFNNIVKKEEKNSEYIGNEISKEK